MVSARKSIFSGRRRLSTQAATPPQGRQRRAPVSAPDEPARVRTRPPQPPDRDGRRHIDVCKGRAKIHGRSTGSSSRGWRRAAHPQPGHPHAFDAADLDAAQAGGTGATARRPSDLRRRPLPGARSRLRRPGRTPRSPAVKPVPSPARVVETAGSDRDQELVLLSRCLPEPAALRPAASRPPSRRRAAFVSHNQRAQGVAPGRPPRQARTATSLTGPACRRRRRRPAAWPGLVLESHIALIRRCARARPRGLSGFRPGNSRCATSEWRGDPDPILMGRNGEPRRGDGGDHRGRAGASACHPHRGGPPPRGAGPGRWRNPARGGPGRRAPPRTGDARSRG